MEKLLKINKRYSLHVKVNDQLHIAQVVILPVES